MQMTNPRTGDMAVWHGVVAEAQARRGWVPTDDETPAATVDAEQADQGHLGADDSQESEQ